MEEAVASENFEDAAQYRDELRALDEQEKTVAPLETQAASAPDEKGEISL